MHRHSPGRNQKSKRLKVKHVLQLCLLVAICFWLIYQVKHSHDKKKEFSESDENPSLQTWTGDGIIKLGRKDIQRRGDATIPKNVKHDEPTEEEETIEEEAEATKYQQEGNKVDVKEDEASGDENDETDEHEHEKSDVEVEREEDFVDVENETEGTDSEDRHGQLEKENSFEDTDNDDDATTHEAREENYKADDASSAVAHDTQISTTGNEQPMDNSNKNPENILEEGNKEKHGEEINKVENRKDIEVEGAYMAKAANQSSITAEETREDMLETSESGSSPNKTMSEGSGGHLGNNSSTEVTSENHDLSLQNTVETETKGNSTEGPNLLNSASDQANNPSLNLDKKHSDSNLMGPAETNHAAPNSQELSNSSDKMPSHVSENITKSEAHVEAGNNAESAAEKNEEIDAEKSDSSGVTDELLESTVTEDPEEVQHDSIDISDSFNALEEKDVRIDIDTLPEIQTEGTHSDDAAEE